MSQFAYDLSLYSKIAPLTKRKKLIEKGIKMVKINLNTFGLNFAPQKTVFIVFNKNIIQPGDF